MKKRIVAGLLGSVCALFAASGTVQAMTYGFDMGSPGNGKGNVTLCVTAAEDASGVKGVTRGTAASGMEDVKKDIETTCEAIADSSMETGNEDVGTACETTETPDIEMEAADAVAGQKTAADQETAAESGPMTEEELEAYTQEIQERIQEYEEAGIGYDEKTGCWLWEEKEIYLLFDEGGAFYQNGSDEAKKNKIYVIVKRNDDGSIKEAKKVTLEDAVKEKIKMDTE